jgi:hypothetical protein
MEEGVVVSCRFLGPGHNTVHTLLRKHLAGLQMRSDVECTALNWSNTRAISKTGLKPCYLLKYIVRHRR